MVSIMIEIAYRRYAPLVVLHEAYDVVLLGERDKVKVILQDLHRGFRDQYMDAVFDRTLGDGIVGVCNTQNNLQHTALVPSGPTHHQG